MPLTLLPKAKGIGNGAVKVAHNFCIIYVLRFCFIQMSRMLDDEDGDALRFAPSEEIRRCLSKYSRSRDPRSVHSTDDSYGFCAKVMLYYFNASFFLTLVFAFLG